MESLYARQDIKDLSSNLKLITKRPVNGLIFVTDAEIYLRIEGAEEGVVLWYAATLKGWQVAMHFEGEQLERSYQIAKEIEEEKVSS